MSQENELSDQLVEMQTQEKKATFTKQMALQARTMNKQEFATLLNQTKQNPSLIDEVLTASF